MKVMIAETFFRMAKGKSIDKITVTDLVEQCGTQAALHDHISHVYYRPSSAPDWPYELYTMIHGRSEAECLGVVEDLKRDTLLREHAVLRSLKELKKISMTYFA